MPDFPFKTLFWLAGIGALVIGASGIGLIGACIHWLLTH